MIESEGTEWGEEEAEKQMCTVFCCEKVKMIYYWDILDAGDDLPDIRPEPDILDHLPS